MNPADWFGRQGWQPHAFQREVWAAMVDGRSGLLHATTGSGKTYAVWFGALARAARAAPLAQRPAGLRVLWITPMRALASDTAHALAEPLTALGCGWTVGMRTGDTPQAERARQERHWPAALVTTPESLSLMLSRERAQQELSAVDVVVVDEWHELVASKRGVQVQLALARLRAWQPRLVVWGLSATLGRVEQAMQALIGLAPGLCVRGRVDKTLTIDTLIPPDPGRFSWAGHLGERMQAPVAHALEPAGTSLVFTNTRSQAEAWYQMLLQQRPDWAGQIALHHGSLDLQVRRWVEQGLKTGQLKVVVATSSLDLGVDFLPVQRVLQVGSPKGVARLLQRAGRSGHAPGRPSQVTLVPTHTLELVEAAAARRAALAGRIESREPPHQPMDVLVQHLVTVALGGGFTPDALYEEVRATASYRDLPRESFDWALGFVTHGGSLHAYPEYRRVQCIDGLYRVPDRGIARRHRMAIGTIVSDASMQVKWLTGGLIGQVEEGFIARLKPGDVFVFSGRLLEYVRTRDLVAYVRKATAQRGVVPTWQGGKMPLSSELADAVLDVLREFDAADGQVGRLPPDLQPELQAAQPMLQAQRRLSRLPVPGRLLLETFRSREGHHLCLYPFAGRHAHLGLASLLAWRLSRQAPNTFSLSVNDYGLELLAAREPDLAGLRSREIFTEAGLLDDVLASLNASELAQRRFREIARVAGLVFTGFPGAPRSMKQLQASSSLFYEVFRRHDAGNRLLAQAEQEVLSQELELERLRTALRRLRDSALDEVTLAQPSPFALPLMVDRLRERLSTEKLADRLQRLLDQMGAADDAAQPQASPASR